MPAPLPSPPFVVPVVGNMSARRGVGLGWRWQQRWPTANILCSQYTLCLHGVGKHLEGPLLVSDPHGGKQVDEEVDKHLAESAVK